MNLPNKLTVFRITLIPLLLLVWLFPYGHFNINIGYITFEHVIVSNKNIIVLIIFTIASITDYLDGYIARKHNLLTTFGKFADPLADKMLVNTMFILLSHAGYLPILPVVLMILRDVIVDGLRMLASSNGVVVSAGFLGKLKTVLQMITIVLVLISNLPFELYFIPVSDFMIWFTTFISIGSGLSYFIQLKDFIFESK